jgi:hypothetical protein
VQHHIQLAQLVARPDRQRNDRVRPCAHCARPRHRLVHTPGGSAAPARSGVVHTPGGGAALRPGLVHTPGGCAARTHHPAATPVHPGEKASHRMQSVGCTQMARPRGRGRGWMVVKAVRLVATCAGRPT